MPNEPISYEEVMKRRGADALKQQEIPDTHAVTLGLPTLRASRPGYAFFASPALRVPGRPQVQDPPDRWWVISAEDAKLLVYARQNALPFSSGQTFLREELTPPACTLEEFKARHRALRELLDAAAPIFFRGESISKQERSTILDLLSFLVPGQLRPQYEALVPDFFYWLEA